MTYERAKYPAEQRAWVAAADERLPGLIEKAVSAQKAAAIMYEYVASLQDCGITVKDTWFRTRRDYSRDAISALNQVLYYQGMRNANR